VKEVFIESHSYQHVTAQDVQVPVLRVTLSAKFRLEEQ
jgi:hypothetical protein